MVWEIIDLLINGVGTEYDSYWWHRKLLICHGNTLWWLSMLWEIIGVVINCVGTDYQWLSMAWETIDLAWELIMMVINGVGNYWYGVRNDQHGYQCCGKWLQCLSTLQALIMMAINDVELIISWLSWLSILWKLIIMVINIVKIDYHVNQWCFPSISHFSP